MTETEPHKVCPRCKRDLPWSAYNLRTKERYTPNGASHNQLGKPQGYCKACDTIWHRELRAKRRRDREIRRQYDAKTRSNPSAQASYLARYKRSDQSRTITEMG